MADLATLFNSQSYVQRQLRINDARYSRFRNIPFFVGTFNVGDKKVSLASNPDLLSSWLKNSLLTEQPMIFGIGFQEIDMSTGGLLSGETGRSAGWVDLIRSTLGPFFSITHKQMMGLLLVVAVHNSLSDSVTVEGYRTCGCGLMGKGGNKGAVVCTLRVDDTRILFCNVHLSAGRSPSGVVKRNRDIYKIFTKTHVETAAPTTYSDYVATATSGIEIFDDFLTYNAANQSSLNANWSLPPPSGILRDHALLPGFPSLLKGHDAVFFFGDMNFRLHTFSADPHLVVEDIYRNAVEGIRKYQSIDQLCIQLRKLQDAGYVPVYTNLYLREKARKGARRTGTGDATTPEEGPQQDSDDEADDDTLDAKGALPAAGLSAGLSYTDEAAKLPFEPCHFLYGFAEDEIRFPPTYKLLKRDADTYQETDLLYKRLSQQLPALGTGAGPGGALLTSPDTKVSITVPNIGGNGAAGSQNFFGALQTVTPGTPDPHRSGSTSSSCRKVELYETHPNSSKPRVPAFCDRVLYRALGPGVIITPSVYDSCPKVAFSDHRPVFLAGHITVRAVDKDRYQRERENAESRARYIVKELEPRFSMSSDTLVFEKASYCSASSTSFTLKNEHPVSALCIAFSRKHIPPWIDISPMRVLVSPNSTQVITVHQLIRYDCRVPRTEQGPYFFSLKQCADNAASSKLLTNYSMETKRAQVITKLLALEKCDLPLSLNVLRSEKVLMSRQLIVRTNRYEGHPSFGAPLRGRRSCLESFLNMLPTELCLLFSYFNDFTQFLVGAPLQPKTLPALVEPTMLIGTLNLRDALQPISETVLPSSGFLSVVFERIVSCVIRSVEESGQESFLPDFTSVLDALASTSQLEEGTKTFLRFLQSKILASRSTLGKTPSYPSVGAKSNDNLMDLLDLDSASMPQNDNVQSLPHDSEPSHDTTPLPFAQDVAGQSSSVQWEDDREAVLLQTYDTVFDLCNSASAACELLLQSGLDAQAATTFKQFLQHLYTMRDVCAVERNTFRLYCLKNMLAENVSKASADRIYSCLQHQEPILAHESPAAVLYVMYDFFASLADSIVPENLYSKVLGILTSNQTRSDIADQIICICNMELFAQERVVLAYTVNFLRDLLDERGLAHILPADTLKRQFTKLLMRPGVIGGERDPGETAFLDILFSLR